MKSPTSWVWLVGLLFPFLANLPSAVAQIIPDSTLPVNSRVAPGCTTCIINGGTERGVNLYHSFRQFSVPTGSEAWFNNSSQIQNILTRVTGSSISNIDGLIKANGTANLFLLNSNGIVFGPNARLEIGGSFFASTATSLKFSDGSEFSATNPQAPPLLTVNLTPGLQTGSIAAGSTIVNRGKLSARQDLTLVSDQLDLQGQLQAGRDLTLQAQNRVAIRDTVTTPFWAVAGARLLMQGSQSVDVSALNHSQSGFWSGRDLVLRSTNPVIGDAHFFAGGNFQVEQLNGSPGKLLSPNDPVILSNGDVTLGDYVGASLHILAGGSVTLGSVEITGTGNVATTINPSNTTLFNGTRTHAELASFNLTDYKATLNSDGSVRSVDAVVLPITVNGSTQATLDVRAGVDWAALGGLPTNPVISGTVIPTLTTSAAASTANITVNGNIKVNQPAGLVLLTNQFSFNPLPGTISIQGNVDVSSTTVNVNGGNLWVYGRGDIVVGNASQTINLSSFWRVFGGGGNGGDITISTRSGNILLTNTIADSSLMSFFDTTGRGGRISFATGSGTLSLINSRLASGAGAQRGAAGNGGNVSFVTGRGGISLTNSPVNTSPSAGLRGGSAGNAGNISFASGAGTISLTNSPLTSAPASDFGRAGNGGNISLTTGFGNISLTGSPAATVSLSDSISLSFPSGGNYDASSGGDISFVASNGNILLANSSLFSSSYSYLGNTGNGGTIHLSARQGTIFGSNSALNSFSISERNASGNGGVVSLEAVNSLSGLTVNTLASGGQSGSVEVEGFGNLEVVNVAILTAQQVTIPPLCLSCRLINVNLTGKSQAGNVTVDSQNNLSFHNSLIQSDTRGVNPGGNITITSLGVVSFNNSQIISNTSSAGAAGNLSIQANQGIILTNGSQLSASTSSAGKAGNMTFNTQQLTFTDSAEISASTSGTGQAGSITFNADRFTISNGARVSTNTSGRGSAGNLAVNVVDQLTLTGVGTGLFAVTTLGSTGNGGNILIDPRTVLIQEGATIAVNSQGSGTGGSISLQAGRLELRDKGSITAETASAQGGNITLDVSDILLLRRNSLISATAGNAQAGGDGGNITIRAPFIIGVLGENSDITANAFTGNGGRIDIATNAIYGLKFQSQLTPFSDITASSQFGLSGTVAINTLNVDPNRGLVALPVNFVETTNQIQASCAAGGRLAQQGNKFVVTGRGGVPESPEEGFRGDLTLISLTELVRTQTKEAAIEPTVRSQTATAIIEAQGWKTDTRGLIYLITDAVESNPHSGWQSPVECLEKNLN